MKQAIAITCLLLGVFIESALWDEHIMQSPDELTVTDFELAEEGLSVVLTNALEDARELVEWVSKQHDGCQRLYVDSFQREPSKTPLYERHVRDAAEMQFRAMRVLGLLEATRDREAGRLA